MTTTLMLPRARSRTWPTLDRWAAGALFRILGRLRYGTLRIDGAFGTREFVGSEDPEPKAQATVLDPGTYRRTLLGGNAAAGADYALGRWISDDPVAVVRIFARNSQLIESLMDGPARILAPLSRWRHRRRDNTRSGSRRNIREHYDLGNDFFELFLDESLTYSSGIYPDRQTTLEDAQRIKLDILARKLDVSSLDHVLEIGTGWGALAVHFARHYGCRVTTTTISREQHHVAVRRVQEAGLEGRVQVLLKDYRDLDGTYDKIVSVEMIEAVGRRHHGSFFRTLMDRLRPEGEALLQAITLADHRFERAQRAMDFIQRWIFPGSCVPSVSALTAAAAGNSDLRLADLEELTPHYARTLADWRARLLVRREEILASGRPNRFVRLFDFYLAYCEGGFAERHIGLHHLLFVRPQNRRGPVSRALEISR